ncbi:MAG TPA: mycothiol synthase [Mycobacteriales bacterium]|nr:mycothiol synthase [Mycobacteriales bacterium]
MTDLRPRTGLTDAESVAVREVVDAASRADGVAPVSEQTLLRLTRPGGEWTLAYVDGEAAGLAFVEDGGGELVVHPRFRRHGVGSALLGGLADDVAIWAHGRLPAAEAFAARHSYVVDRVLLKMHRSLAEPLPDASFPAGITVRTFVPGQDEAAWLEVNRRAFSHHPEQGSWTREDLQDREEQPWFDPAGFFLAVEDGALRGFHWTKTHDETTGEIFVLAVDPAAQGRRLGPALAVAGLQYLHDRGLTDAILYVEESQSGAVRLYERLGFTRASVDVQFRRAL